MSLAYRANWVTVSSTVTHGDTLNLELSLLGILPAPEMAALMRETLRADGWREGPSGALEKREGEVTMTLSPDGQRVEARLALTREVSTRAPDEAAAKVALEGAAQRAEDEVRATAAARLTALEPDLRVKLGEAVQRVYAEALRTKAAALGEVESVRETRDADGAYEVTIRVKV